MAAFLIGAGILLTDKLVQKHKLKKQAKRLQQEQIADTQAGTARRRAKLADQSHRDDDAPPSYEELYGKRRSSSEERRKEDEDRSAR